MKLKFLQENLIDEKSIIKILKDYIDISRKPKLGSVFLTKDGTFINLGENEDDSHGDIISYLENEDIFLFDDHWQFSENFGYIRMNSGTTTDFNAYIEFLEDKPTSEQYDGIENWLYYILNSGVKEVEINVPNSKSIRYSLVDYLPEDIIKKVKRYYGSGNLYESSSSTTTIKYRPVSNIDKFKKYADEILGGYGGMSDSDIKRDIEEIYIDGELKGYIGLSKYNEEDGTKLLGIGNFMIIERGRGYGTQVIKDIVSKYKNEYDLIYCFVDSDNEGAISLYKKLGKVYDEDGPNDNGQYYVTFYNNGKYKLEEDFGTSDVIAYHGSNAKFNKFDLKYFGRTDDGMWGKGIYFISDKRVAQSFGSDYLYTCRLKLNKPYIIDMSTVGNNEDSEDSSKYYSLTNRNNNILKRKGHDSIIVKDELWEGSFTTRANEYIVFDPSDIEIIDVKDLSLEESYSSNKNIDDIKTPEQLMDWMEEHITYELANDEYGAEDDPPTKTAEEVIETGTGHCAEQSYLEKQVLDELGYDTQLIFIKENSKDDDYGADGSAHMFVVYQDNYKYIYFEHSQEHSKGIHTFDTLDKLFDFVGKNWWRYDENSDVLEFRCIDEPITGVDNWELAQECHKAPMIYEYDISNNIMEEDVPLDAKWDYNKHKIVQESLVEDVDMSSEQDSEGNILTLEQAKYFSNSKVRDKSGRLLVCYHSTDEEFDEFDSSYSWDNFGFHFGTKEAAEDIGGEIMKSCYLNITNPLVLKEDLQYWDAFSFIRLLYENPQLQKDIKIDGWEEIKEQYEEDLEYDDFDESFYCAEYGDVVRDALYNSKYDGIIYTNWGEDAGSISYMCFYPEQIKYIDNKAPTRSKRMNEGAYDDQEEDVSEQITNEFLDVWNDFYHCSTEDVLGLLEYTPSDKIDASSPMFILPNGKIVNVADVLEQWGYEYPLVHHALPQLMAYVILKDICSSYGKQVEQFMYEEDGLLDKVTDEMINNLTYSKDWARINCGTSYVETRFYCVLPNYMKSAQYSALEEWLLWGEQNNRHEVLVFCGNEHQSQKYKFDELFTEGIMKKIKRFYSSGVLHEDVRVQKEFEPYTAGYILENGDLVILDEYHGEDTTYNNKGLVEFSNTHNEDDTCIRVYKIPTKQQYERMEEIFQHYLDNEQYCKVEIWNSKTGYDFYEIFSLVEGACSDDSWNERVGNWSGYDLVKVIKNYYNNRRKIDEPLQEVLIYRGEGERNYSVGRTPMAGLFYATNYDDASNFSDNVVKYKLRYDSKIYKGQSSLNYCIENDLMNIQDKDLKNMLGVSSIIDMYEESSVPDGYFPKDEYLDDRPFFGTQLIAKKDLQKKGYDGAYWKWEDDLTPQQYQIWNMSVVEKVGQIKEDFSTIDKSEYLKFQSYVESIIDRKIKIVNRELDKFGFEVEYIDDYDFTENDEWIGVFYNEIQDAADVFPIAINIPFLYRECKKDKYLKDDLPYHIEKTIWHEVGHGIFEYLYDVFDLKDLDEEKVVEEYASYQVGDMNSPGDLLDYLYQYLENN